MNLEEIRSNRTKIILKFSIPSIIAMLLTALITVADGYFMGNYVGKEGIAAVNLGLPVIYLYLGVGLMISIGGVAISGMALGAGDRKTANQVFRQTIGVTGGCSLVISLVMAVSFPQVLAFLGADQQVSQYFREYYEIMLLELPVMVVNSSLGMFIRGEGNSGYYMKVSMGNVLLNIFLDYFFAGPLGLGAGGIAAASLVSALFSLGLLLYYFWKRARIYSLGAFRFSGKTCIQAVLNGSSEFIGEMSTGIAMFAYNYVILRRIGTVGVTAFTIVGYVAYAFSMVIVGFGQGCSPLISFTYGAGERALAADIRKRTNWLVLGTGATVFFLLFGASGWYGRIFVQHAGVEEMVEQGMGIFMVSFFFSGMNAITSFYFTATGRALESAAISLSRGLVVLLLCIFTLPIFFGMTGVWLAAPVTEAVTLGITGGFLYRERVRGY